jgi:hypothetical protein
MEEFLLNMMGSAAVASAVIVGFMATQGSRELAGKADPPSGSPRKRPD